MTKYEYLYIAFRLIGRGYTGEIVDLHIEGTPSQKYDRLPKMLAELGEEGWELKTSTDKGENGTYQSMIFFRMNHA